MAHAFVLSTSRRDRIIAVAALAILGALAWRYLLRLAHAVTLEDMGVTTPDLLMTLMPSFKVWGNHTHVVAFAMWAVVMAGLQAPMLKDDAAPAARTVAGWLVFSLAAAFAQGFANRLALEAWVIVHAAAAIGGAVLIAAAASQWIRHRTPWPLLVLLFLSGVLNLVWVAVIAAAALIERALPAGKIVARVLGLAFAAAGASLIAMAALTP